MGWVLLQTVTRKEAEGLIKTGGSPKLAGVCWSSGVVCRDGKYSINETSVH